MLETVAGRLTELFGYDMNICPDNYAYSTSFLRDSPRFTKEGSIGG